MYKLPKTRRGADRQYAALLRAYKKAFADGGAFGWDWRTLRLNAPDVWAHMQLIARIYDNLPA